MTAPDKNPPDEKATAQPVYPYQPSQAPSYPPRIDNQGPLEQPPVVQAHRSQIHLGIGCLTFSLTGGSLIAALVNWWWVSYEAGCFMAMVMAMAGLSIGIVYVHKILHDLRLMQQGQMDPQGLRGTRIAYVLVWLAVWPVPFVLFVSPLAVIALGYYLSYEMRGPR